MDKSGDDKTVRDTSDRLHNEQVESIDHKTLKRVKSVLKHLNDYSIRAKKRVTFSEPVCTKVYYLHKT